MTKTTTGIVKPAPQAAAASAADGIVQILRLGHSTAFSIIKLWQFSTGVDEIRKVPLFDTLTQRAIILLLLNYATLDNSGFETSCCAAEILSGIKS